jgi:hypothetical protein
VTETIHRWIIEVVKGAGDNRPVVVRARPANGTFKLAIALPEYVRQYLTLPENIAHRAVMGDLQSMDALEELFPQCDDAQAREVFNMMAGTDNGCVKLTKTEPHRWRLVVDIPKSNFARRRRRRRRSRTWSGPHI